MRNSARWGVGRWGRVVGAVVVLAVTVVGCAAPLGPARTMRPGDFKMLEGTWDGSEVITLVFPNGSSYAGGSSRRAVPDIQGVIQESGTFFTVLRSSPGGQRPGVGGQRPGIMKIGDDGVVTYKTATSDGTMTFHESQDGKSWVWKWDGKTAEGHLERNQLTKPK